jgi:hypothetical protein
VRLKEELPKARKDRQAAEECCRKLRKKKQKIFKGREKS